MVISDVIICDARGERKGDVRIEGGVITQIGENLTDTEMVPASGWYLLPGLVDTNVRLKDSQLSGKNLESLSRHALEGGVTTVVLASDSYPRIDNEITLEFVQKHQYLPHGASIETTLSALSESGTLSNIAIMLKKGSLAVHTSTLTDYNLLSRIAQYLKMAQKPLFYRAEDKSLFESGVMSDGAVATRLGLPGISPLSEVVHIASMIEIARHFEIEIVFKSVTEPRSVELIAQAAAEGVKVQCEVSIHHLLHSDEACSGFDSDAKINPPLVSVPKQHFLIDALKEGKIDSLTALHQPNSDVHKDITFFDASYGTTSIAEYLPLCYTHLVKSGLVSMSRLVGLASQAPAAQVGLSAGIIEEGCSADVVLFDPAASTPVLHHHSLYKNEVLDGKVMMALCAGEVTRF